MKTTDRSIVNDGKLEIHCSLCGALVGRFPKDTDGEGLTCGRCKRRLSFALKDGLAVVSCRQDKG